MSRIIGGAGKGRRLKTAGGDSTRPTGARVRQSLFDILAPFISGCRFLDAFAGNGGVGLEALSRGAAKVVLVDKASAAVEAAKENARALAGAGGEVQVFRQDARTAIGALADQGMQFDVVYLDPPYASDLYEPLLALLGEGPLLAEGGVVVAEHFHKRALPETIGALIRTREKNIGAHCLSFYRRGSTEGRETGGEAE
jgi:16S rRNA (guanine966-N2)-methyltransferase